MLVVLNFGGGQNGGSWFIGPLIGVLLPLLLQGGGNLLVGMLVGAGVSASWGTVLVAVVLLAACVYGVAFAALGPEGGRLLWQVFFTGVSGGGGGGNAAAAGATNGAGRGPPTAQQRQQRWEKVVSVLQGLPTETVASREQLAAESPAALKARLAKQGISCSGCVEKEELVSRLMEAGGSSGAGCSVCCEDYQPGVDVLRLLPCGHRFHLECVDRWFLSACQEYTRPPACPMCNASLLPQEDG